MVYIRSDTEPDAPTKVGLIFLDVVNETQKKAIEIANASFDEIALVDKTYELIDEAQDCFKARVHELGDVIHQDYMPEYIEVIAENFGIFKFYDRISDLLEAKSTEVDKELFSDLRI